MSVMESNNLSEINELDSETKEECLKYFQVSVMECKNSPEIHELDPETEEEFYKYFQGIKPGGLAYFGSNSYIFPEYVKEIKNLELRDGDVFVITIPRSGTTWTQEMVWLIKMDLDYERAKREPLIERFPFISNPLQRSPELYNNLLEANKGNETKLSIIRRIYGQTGVQRINTTPSPRFIKSHSPLSLFPSNLLDVAKVVYVVRDPRDVIVSRYHYSRLVKYFNYVGDFKTFWRLFMKIWGSTYLDHVKEAWKLRHHPNMLFLSYDEMIKDLPSIVRRVAKFFNKEYTDEQYDKLCHHLSFDQFKKNASVNFDYHKKSLGLCLLAGDEDNTFIRKGKSGGWRDYFDEEMTQITQQWIYDNLGDSDLRTCYSFRNELGN